MMRMMRMFFILGFLAMLATPPAYSAQDSTIITDNAPVRIEPKNSGKVLEYLPLGSEVRVSSYPMAGGWYKIRSKTGIYGWIHESVLSVYKPGKDDLATKKPEDLTPRPERDRKFFLRVLGGFDFFRPDDLNAIFGFSDLNTGYTVGGEAGYFISERVAVVFRSEAMVKDIVARENTSNLQFNLATRSYPIMGGMDFYIAKLPAMRLSFGIFGGVALATSFSSQATGLSPPNVMVLQASPFTSLARLNLTRPLGRILSVFMELGYRYLRTTDIDTISATNIQGGPQIYAKDGAFRPRVIDLSGVEVGVGLGVHF
jgi:hypothetical protein